MDIEAINDALGIPTDSEDNFDFSDEDETFIPETEPDVSDELDVSDEEMPVNMPSTSARPSTKTNGPPKYRNLLWKKGNIAPPNDNFLGSEYLADKFLELKEPYDFFKYLFSDTLMEKIVEESIRYSVQLNPAKPFEFSTDELKKYIGICILMSVVHLPNVRAYWNDTIGNYVIRDTMPVNVFENIRRFLHFNDSDQAIPKGEPGHDRLHKLRPVIDLLKERFISVPLEQSLSVDEQMCATKARHYMKQYMPMKPHKWGYQIFVICGVSGYAYDFEVYSGQENDEANRRAEEPDLGASANIVVRLCRSIPTDQNYKLYFDNYYTSLPLVVYLYKRGIESLGTLRRNRVQGLKLSSEAELRKKGRGTSEECTTTVEDVDVSAVAWMDNKVVTLLSTFVGKLPLVQVKRFNKKTRERDDVECPQIITAYNRHMGGVDLLDSILGRYKIKMRTKKWYFRLFYHFLDVTVINSWLLYRRVLVQKGIEKYKPLAEFRTELAVTLCKMGKEVTLGRGRPSSTTLQTLLAQKCKRKAATITHPPKDVRQDETGHWPKVCDTRQRCKHPNCDGKSFVQCGKCNVALCLNKTKNCFVAYHKD